MKTKAHFFPDLNLGTILEPADPNEKQTACTKVRLGALHPPPDAPRPPPRQTAADCSGLQRPCDAAAAAAAPPEHWGGGGGLSAPPAWTAAARGRELPWARETLAFGGPQGTGPPFS
jgi:hypothetical protein